MMYYDISSQAVADLDQIWDYISEDSGNPATATSVIKKITNVFPKIGKFPYIGRSRHGDLGLERRSFAVNNYTVIYKIQPTEIQILRVLHASVDTQARFEDK